MNPTPTSTPPQGYSPEETARLLAQREFLLPTVSERQLAGQLAACEEERKREQNETAQQKARADAARDGYLRVSADRARLQRENEELIELLKEACNSAPALRGDTAGVLLHADVLNSIRARSTRYS
jgi:molecular chaperone GrpE (heat shock protein)